MLCRQYGDRAGNDRPANSREPARTAMTWTVLLLVLAGGALPARAGGVADELERIQTLLDAGAVVKRTALVPAASWALEKGKWNTLFEETGPGMITHIWFTYPFIDRDLGRRNLLRMYWDGESKPSVEAPLGDFFGVPFGFAGTPAPAKEHPGTDYLVSIFDYAGPRFELDSHYLVVGPNNGLNCYFPMPFEKSARIEILPEQLESGSGFYVQIDYVTFPEGIPAKWKDLRFHAQFRFENPCRDYGNYVFLDAVGRGALVGLNLAIEANDDPIDFWPHGGGDTIFIDGGTSHPTVLHGIGTEDFFGQSWGVLRFNSAYLGTSYYEIKQNHPQVDPEQFERLSVYRFMVEDPIVFHESIRGVMGCMANRYASVAYWYQTEPHRPFFEVPPADERMPDAVAPRGTYDLPTGEGPTWQLLGPFEFEPPDGFERVRACERFAGDLGTRMYDAKGNAVEADDGNGSAKVVGWKPETSWYNFVDFKEACGLAPNRVGYALQYIESGQEKDAACEIGYDDQIAVRVNGDWVYRGHHAKGFATDALTLPLKKGRNEVLIKLSNEPNTNFKLWAFWLRPKIE